jgi:hypothetical protein
MGTDAISPLRQRMIEDMSARKLNPHGSQANSFCRTFRPVDHRSRLYWLGREDSNLRMAESKAFLIRRKTTS